MLSAPQAQVLTLFCLAAAVHSANIVGDADVRAIYAVPRPALIIMMIFVPANLGWMSPIFWDFIRFTLLPKPQHVWLQLLIIAICSPVTVPIALVKYAILLFKYAIVVYNRHAEVSGSVRHSDPPKDTKKHTFVLPKTSPEDQEAGQAGQAGEETAEPLLEKRSYVDWLRGRAPKAVTMNK